MSRTYSIELACGCLIAEEDTDGWCGAIVCGANYYDAEDLKNEDNRKHYDLCKECWEQHNLKYNPKHRLCVWKGKEIGTNNSRIPNSYEVYRKVYAGNDEFVVNIKYLNLLMKEEVE